MSFFLLSMQNCMSNKANNAIPDHKPTWAVCESDPKVKASFGVHKGDHSGVPEIRGQIAGRIDFLCIFKWNPLPY